MLARYDRATADERLAGRQWYPRARQYAEAIAGAADITDARAAALLAAVSPRVPWGRAVTLAFNAAHGLPVGHFRAVRHKVDRLMSGHPIPDVLGTSPKCLAFAQNIIGMTDPVTVDVHMWRAAGIAPSPGRYERVADAVRDAAAMVGETARDMQAIVWIVERGGAH